MALLLPELEGETTADIIAASERRVTPLGEELGARFVEGFKFSFIGQAFERLGLIAEGGATDREVNFLRGTSFAPFQLAGEAFAIDQRTSGRKRLNEAEWRASRHFREGIPFRAGITKEGAAARAEAFDARQYRRSLIARGPGGFFRGALGFGATLLGGALDPVNFIPVLGPAARGALVARAGIVGGRALTGVAEAAIGTAAVEPLIVASLAETGEDVSFGESLQDIALSAAVGGIFGTGTGLFARRRAPSGLSIVGPTPRGPGGDVVPLGEMPLARIEDQRATARAAREASTINDRDAQLDALDLSVGQFLHQEGIDVSGMAPHAFDGPRARSLGAGAAREGAARYISLGTTASREVGQTITRLLDLVETEGGTRPKGTKPVPLGLVTTGMTGRLNAAARQTAADAIDVGGFTFALDHSAIVHTLRRHGVQATETSRGQLAIGRGDFDRLPGLLQAADDPVAAGLSRRGHPAVVISARHGNLEYLTLWEIRTGRQDIALISMIKRDITGPGTGSGNGGGGVGPQRPDSPEARQSSDVRNALHGPDGTLSEPANRNNPAFAGRSGQEVGSRGPDGPEAPQSSNVRNAHREPSRTLQEPSDIVNRNLREPGAVERAFDEGGFEAIAALRDAVPETRGLTEAGSGAPDNRSFATARPDAPAPGIEDARAGRDRFNPFEPTGRVDEALEARINDARANGSLRPDELARLAEADAMAARVERYAEAARIAARCMGRGR